MRLHSDGPERMAAGPDRGDGSRDAGVRARLARARGEAPQRPAPAPRCAQPPLARRAHHRRPLTQDGWLTSSWDFHLRIIQVI